MLTDRNLLYYLLVSVLLIVSPVCAAAQNPAEIFKSMIGDWALDAAATRAANPARPDDPYAKSLELTLAKNIVIKVLPTGVLEENGPDFDSKKAFKVALTHEGQLLLIAQYPHRSGAEVSLITLTKDRLILNFMDADDDLKYQPTKPAFVFTRK